MNDIGSNLIAEILSGLLFIVMGSIITITAIKFAFFRNILRKIGVNIKLSRPQLDLDLEYDGRRHTTKVIIKNAGDQAAFNAYCYLFEIFHASKNGDYKITSLGSQKIKAGILAPGEKIIFEGRRVQFDSCNVTTEQELWVEYTDETNQHFRTRIIPRSPRGDDLRVAPPVIIRYRLPRLPGLNYKGQRNYEAIRSGRSGLPGNLRYI